MSTMGRAANDGVALMSATPCMPSNAHTTNAPSHRLPKAMKTCAAQQGRLSDRLSDLHHRITQSKQQHRGQPMPVGVPVKATGQPSSIQRLQDVTQKDAGSATNASSSTSQKSAPSTWTLVDVLSIKDGARSISTHGGGRFIARVKASINTDVGTPSTTANPKLKRREAIERVSSSTKPLSVSFEEERGGTMLEVASFAQEQQQRGTISWRFGDDASSQLDKVTANRQHPSLQPRVKSIYEIGRAAAVIASLSSAKMPPPVLLEETPSFATGKTFGGGGKVTIKVVRREGDANAASPTRSTKIVIKRASAPVVLSEDR